MVIFIGRLMPVRAQDSTQAQVNEDVERAVENLDPEQDNLQNEELLQYLGDLSEHPVNINHADLERLLEIPALNLKTARAIVSFRNNHKVFESIRELTNVPGIGKVTLHDLRPYVIVGDKNKLHQDLYSDYRYWMHHGHVEYLSRLQQTLQPMEGYLRTDSSGYLGSPLKYYQRLGYRSDHISVNITQEKDAGELLKGPTKFDYNSGHIAFSNIGELKSLVIGDYSLSFGQGLALRSGGLFGKGRNITGAPNRKARGIKPYRSSSESNYFRGLAATFGHALQATLFASKRKLSATMVNNDTTHYPSATGYHRTFTELGKRNDIEQRVVGGHLSAKFRSGIVGVTAYHLNFSKYIAHSSAVYDQYDFEGQRASAVSMDYRFINGPAILFGEGVRSLNGGMGFVNGAELEAGDRMKGVLVYRNYQKNLHSLLGNGFGEQSGEPQNEEGIYTGLKHQLNQNIEIGAYFDQFRFMAPRYGDHFPGEGHDWLFYTAVDFSKKWKGYFMFRGERKSEEYKKELANGRLHILKGQMFKNGVRLHMEYQLSPKARLRTRGELIWTRHPDQSTEVGYLLYQDLRIRPLSNLRIDARMCVFDTESYDSRVYEFENDLLYVMSSTMLYQQGQRMYVLLDYEPTHFMEIWLKYGVTFYENQQTIGSGLNRIVGNKKRQVGFEVRFKF